VASARFEEKEFEGAATRELTALPLWSRRPAAYWPVGQVFEAVLGIDAAFGPAKREIWRLLQLPRPRGVVVTPDLWVGSPGGLPSADDLSRQRVSLFVNFKRPEAYKRKGRKMFGGPYFRFTVRSRPPSPNQHGILSTLAANITDDVAVVRYAAAAFQQRTELEAFMTTRDVLQNTCFVSPLAIVAPHMAWAYEGPDGWGAPNPEGDPVPSERLGDLVERVTAEARAMTIRKHLRQLAEAAADTLPARLREQIDEWLASAGQLDAIPQTSQTLGSLGDLVVVASAATRAGARWVHLVRHDGPLIMG
jgi:hypothetical protein